MITYKNISYSYNRSTIALDDISASIGNGIHLLLGENGAGKTTLLHITAGLLIPQKGECIVEGYPIAARTPSALATSYFLAENPPIVMPTINELFRYHAPFYPGSSNRILQDCLGEFGLTGNEKLSSLSLGNRKKSEIAYAISLQTPVLLLDEPANGLDIDSKKALQRLFARHISDSRTLIISTHTVWDFQNLFDGVIILNKGKMPVALPTWQITERLAFVITPEPDASALYHENGIEGCHAIINNTDGIETDIDFNLLYSSLRSPKANEIIEIVNRPPSSATTGNI